MNRSRNHGFTLLELLVVVLIIGLAVTLTYPSLSRGATSIRMRAAGRDILNTFRVAREKAVAEQTGMRVTVDRAKQELILANDLGDGVRRYRLPEDVQIEKMAWGGAEVTEGPMAVRFLPNGSAESAEVVLKSRTGAFLRVVTDPLTGGARVESGLGEAIR